MIDVTSKGPDPWVKFSPFYPHYDIPVPFWEGKTAACVEAIWQALKVFETADVDEAALSNGTMRNIKRTVRRFSKVLGHRRMDSGELLAYVDARRMIYLPSYRWVLEHQLQEEVTELHHMVEGQTVVPLDYETNEDVEDTRRPLSHAGLVVRYLKDDWPS